MFNLTITTNGKGKITKSPDQDSYDDGSQVVLTAVPDAGQTFTGWSGAASGTVNPLSVTMDAD